LPTYSFPIEETEEILQEAEKDKQEAQVKVRPEEAAEIFS